MTPTQETTKNVLTANTVTQSNWYKNSFSVQTVVNWNHLWSTDLDNTTVHADSMISFQLSLRPARVVKALCIPPPSRLCQIPGCCNVFNRDQTSVDILTQSLPSKLHWRAGRGLPTTARPTSQTCVCVCVCVILQPVFFTSSDNHLFRTLRHAPFSCPVHLCQVTQCDNNRTYGNNRKEVLNINQ